MEKKPPGRPKMYDSAADKLGAFRQRLESAGFRRKELLVTQETWDQVVDLAKENGVSASDAASGLLEYGIKAFMSKKSNRITPSDLKALVSAPPSVPVAASRKSNLNPIAGFFVKRKESAQASIDKEKP